MTGTWMAILTGGLALLAAGSAAATTTILDFDAAEACDGVCSNGRPVRQAYGDTADVAVSFRARFDFGESGIIDANPLWWDQGFGDLQGVIFFLDTLEVRFDLLTPGSTITLDSLDMARTGTGPVRTELRVYDLDWTLLWSAENLLAPVGGRLSFTPGVSSTTGLILQHGRRSLNRGLDNIVFTISDAPDAGVIPEPATWAMLIIGFGLVGGVVRRRCPDLPVQGRHRQRGSKNLWPHMLPFCVPRGGAGRRRMERWRSARACAPLPARQMPGATPSGQGATACFA